MKRFDRACEKKRRLYHGNYCVRCLDLEGNKKKMGAGLWKEKTYTSGWDDQPGDCLKLLTFSARNPIRLRGLVLLSCS